MTRASRPTPPTSWEAIVDWKRRPTNASPGSFSTGTVFPSSSSGRPSREPVTRDQGFRLVVIGSDASFVADGARMVSERVADRRRIGYSPSG
jgi:hypothetical protein